MTQLTDTTKPTYTKVADKTLRKVIPLPAMPRHGITTASLVLSAWAIVLAQVSGPSDVVFGRLTSGRNFTAPGIKDIFSACINITPVQARTDATTNLLGFLQEIQAQHLASLSYENAGFRHIIEKCTDWAPWTRFSSVVNHVHVDPGLKDPFTLCEGLKYDFDVFEPAHDKSDLWLQTKPVGEQMEVELRFSKAVISMELAEAALQLFCDVVQRASVMAEKSLYALTEGREVAFKGFSSPIIVAQR
jgi:hypothetical protein